MPSRSRAREAAGRAADAQREVKAAQKTVDDLREASKASGSPVDPEKALAAQQKLDTAIARAAEVNHDKALAGFNWNAEYAGDSQERRLQSEAASSSVLANAMAKSTNARMRAGNMRCAA